MSDELDQVLSNLQSKQVPNADADFMAWWDDLDETEQERYQKVLRERAALVLPNRDELLECLPWNLKPTDDEISAMLSKYYPEGSDISFLRECLRWAAISKATPTGGRAIVGARTLAMVDFSSMMVKRHSRGDFDRDRISKELDDMASSGHFMELSHGLYTPNLLAVKASENQLLIISGFPFKRLHDFYPTLQNLECGSYTISPEEWKHEILSLYQYTQGPDEIKAMSESASQYIEARVSIASSNDPGSELPDVGNLLTPVGEVPAFALGGKMYLAGWSLGDGRRTFFIENPSYSPEYQQARMWVCDDEKVIMEPRGKQWRSTEISNGTLKQIQIAHLNLRGEPCTLDQAINKIRSFEAYRFSVVRDAIGVDDEATWDFCERNWLKVD
jgi:hypothetical protein